ncbi:hypothetical protein PCE1_000582 [Barthelona sp. PCE]
MSLVPNTQRFQNFIEGLSTLKSKKVHLLAKFVCEELSQGLSTFESNQETLDLFDSLDIAQSLGHDLISGLIYIYQQSIYLNLDGEELYEQLQASGFELKERQCVALCSAFEEHRDKLVALAQTTKITGVNNVENCLFNLQTIVSSSYNSKSAEPKAVMSLFNDDEPLLIKFNNEELRNLYIEVEKIQQALDSITE